MSPIIDGKSSMVSVNGKVGTNFLYAGGLHSEGSFRNKHGLIIF
ncbi:hypothetical protein LXEBMM8_EKPBGFGD_01137 [Lactiplantibacillus xiangfangensis]